MKKFYFSMISMLCIGSMMFAQNSGKSDDFKPSGKPIATIYTDFASMTTGSTSTTSSKTNNAFELSRAYFGYAYNFSPNFSGKVLFDIANSGSASPSAFDAFIKNAFVEYNDKTFTVDLGMIGGTMFNLQESTWGKRYLYKSFQDQYGFGNSADLGITAKVKFAPEVSFDLSLLNGEGYKKIQSDSTLKVAAGLTFTPVKEFKARVYYDYYKKPNETGYSKDQNSFNVFAAYTGKDVTLAAEYNLQNGNGFKTDHNWSGISVYGIWNASKYINVFARFDDLTSKKISGTEWSASSGATYMAGVEFIPVKGVQIAPNFRYFNPSISDKASNTTLAVNVGLNF
jgi:hypothetical protein